jgi:hypothetical protein
VIVLISRHFLEVLREVCGPGNSVGIATELRSRRSGIRPALGPTQPPVKWVPGLSRGVKCGRGVLLTTHPPSSVAVMEV